MKQVLVYHGKHGDVYWDATDKDKALWAMFVLLDESYNFYEHIKDVDVLEKILQEKKDTLERLEASVPPVDDVLNPGHIQAIKQVEREVCEYNRYVTHGKLYRSAKKGNVKGVVSLLSWRSEYEYEGWDIEELEEVE